MACLVLLGGWLKKPNHGGFSGRGMTFANQGEKSFNQVNHGSDNLVGGWPKGTTTAGLVV
jgi:hypothetical protein